MMRGLTFPVWVIDWRIFRVSGDARLYVEWADIHGRMFHRWVIYGRAFTGGFPKGG